MQEQIFSQIQALLSELRDAIIHNRELPYKKYTLFFNITTFRYQIQSEQNIQFSLKSIGLITRITRILIIVLQLLRDNVIITKRNLYYQMIKYYQNDYAQVDKDIRLICQTLKIKRSQLNIMASNKGLVNGDIIWQQNDKIIELYSGKTQYIQIGGDIKVQCIISKRVLIIQKQSIFNYLLQNKLNQGYLIITSKGYPDYKTRQLILQISKHTSQIYYLGDLDPFGFDIYLSYLIGNHLQNYGVPELKLLDIQKLILFGNLDENQLINEYQAWTAADIQKMKSILSEQYFKQDLKINNVEDFEKMQKLQNIKLKLLKFDELKQKIQLQSFFKCLNNNKLANFLDLLIQNQMYI